MHWNLGCCCCNNVVGYWGGLTQGGGNMDQPPFPPTPAANATWTIDFPAGTVKRFGRTAANLSDVPLLMMNHVNLPVLASDFDAIGDWITAGGTLFVMWDYSGVTGPNLSVNRTRMNTFLSHIGAGASWGLTNGAAPAGITTTPTIIFNLDDTQREADPIFKGVMKYDPSAPGFIAMTDPPVTDILNAAHASQAATTHLAVESFGSGTIYYSTDSNFVVNPTSATSDNDIMLANLLCNA